MKKAANGTSTVIEPKPDVSVQQTSADVQQKKIGEAEIRKANEIFQKYRKGKKHLEEKIVENEQFWKLRHWEAARKEKQNTPATSWLWSMIVLKHADIVDAYPEPNFLARARDDEPEAKRLSAIVPVIMEQNNYPETYSDCGWYKCKQGASCTGVFWDGGKLNGLGDISIKKIDLLNLFWQPGITDIQASRHLFHIELVDKDIIEQRYPQTKDRLGASGVYNVKEYLYDEDVDTSDKCCVVDWYYHTEYDGIRKLHLCKYVDDIVLFASENEPDKYPNGWYAHGMYPFIIDSLYDIEGSICGYGYTDINKDSQIQIDEMSDAMVKNTILASKPRFIVRSDGGINETEYADTSRDIIHTEGRLGEDDLREVKSSPLNGNSLNMLQMKIDEMKDTSGNKDVSTGGAPSGVTAASAIAALQETAGKTSRDMLSTTYSAYKKLVYMVIELIREFYTFDRQFRITGEDGTAEYISYNNSAIQPQHQGNYFGYEGGYRLPVFDIVVTAQKANPYSRMEQNELSLQFYQYGFYNPQNADQALACLDAMDFDTKDKVKEIISRNATLYEKATLYAQLSYALAAKYEPQTAAQISQDVAMLGVQISPEVKGGSNNITGNTVIEKARQGAAASTQPY